MWFWGRIPKKAEPSSKRDEASRNPPIDKNTDRGDHRLVRGRSKSLQPPKMSVFNGDQNKQS